MSAGLEVIESWAAEVERKKREADAAFAAEVDHLVEHVKPKPADDATCGNPNCDNSYCRGVFYRKLVKQGEIERAFEIRPDKLVEVEATMKANPACAVCGFGFTAAVTFCPNCGARR